MPVPTAAEPVNHGLDGLARVGSVRARPARGRPPGGTRRRFPARTLHLVDIENLAGAAIPSLLQVIEVQDRYARLMALGTDDHVVMASNHLALVNAAVGWPHARYRVRSGPDGADLELLDVIWHENVVARFSHVVIGSGDGVFGGAAESLAAGGVWVSVVSRWGSLAPSLARAARDVIYLDGPRLAA